MPTTLEPGLTSGKLAGGFSGIVIHGTSRCYEQQERSSLLKTIHLIRHGPSVHMPPRGWVDAAGFLKWRNDCDGVGINPADLPPDAAREVVSQSDAIVSSDLLRAIETARRLAPARPVLQSALLRETRIGIPEASLIRMPVSAWDAVAHMGWGFRILQKVDVAPEDTQRADQVLAWVTRLERAQTISVVTHGVFRRILANRAVESGWRELTHKRSYRCWSHWTFAIDSAADAA